MIHIEAGTEIRMLHLESQAVHDVPYYQLVVCAINGVSGGMTVCSHGFHATWQCIAYGKLCITYYFPK